MAVLCINIHKIFKALGSLVSHAILFWIMASYLYMYFQLSAVIFVVNSFNTDALLAHGSLLSGFIESRYPILFILMHVWLDGSLAPAILDLGIRLCVH